METFPAVIAEDRWALEKQQQMFATPMTAMSRCFCGPTALCAGRAKSRARTAVDGESNAREALRWEEGGGRRRADQAVSTSSKWPFGSQK